MSIDYITYRNQKSIEYEQLLKEKEQAILNYCLDTHNINKYQQLINEGLQKNGINNELIVNTLCDFKFFMKVSKSDNRASYFYNKESLAAFISWLKYKKISSYITFFWEKLAVDKEIYKGLSARELAKMTKLEYIKAERFRPRSNVICTSKHYIV